MPFVDSIWQFIIAYSAELAASVTLAIILAVARKVLSGRRVAHGLIQIAPTLSINSTVGRVDIGGQSYAKVRLLNGPNRAMVRYSLNGRYRTFSAIVRLDSEFDTSAPVRLRVVAVFEQDQRDLCEATIGERKSTEELSIDVSNVVTLEIVAEETGAETRLALASGLFEA